MRLPQRCLEDKEDEEDPCLRGDATAVTAPECAKMQNLFSKRPIYHLLEITVDVEEKDTLHDTEYTPKQRRVIRQLAPA